MSKKKSNRRAPRKRSGRDSAGFDPKPYRFDRFHMADATPYDEGVEDFYDVEASYDDLDEIESWRVQHNPHGDSDFRGRRSF